MKVYRCANPGCRFIKEETGLIAWCPRCGEDYEPEPLTEDEVVRLIDCGEIVHCNACRILHSGPMAMDVESLARG